MSHPISFLSSEHFVHDLFLPWASLVLSLFIAILLVWLGLTVLLNSDRRSGGTWLAGCGLLLGGAFFLAHAASLDLSSDSLMEKAQWWWGIMAVPVLGLPYGWLVLMLWYCGFWDEAGEELRFRLRAVLMGATGLLISLGVLLVFTAPTLGRNPFGGPSFNNRIPFVGFRELLLLYPLFLLTCTGASLDALSRPAPAGRFMGEEARRRARPWLLWSSLVQFAASIGIAALLLYAGYRSLNDSLIDVAGKLFAIIDWSDVAVQLCFALAVVMLGKAVVSYEIFTGKILPRSGFWRQWRAVVILGGTYAVLVSFALSLVGLPPIFPILLTTLLMSVFLALASHRAYGERERAVSDLRPFVASQHLYDCLVSGDTQRLESSMDEPFRALCEGVLGASKACLMARGPLAALTGPPRLFPVGLALRPGWLELSDAHSVSTEPCVAMLPESEMTWLIPLGGSRSLGTLLLGEKLDRSLYTYDEIEVARAASEHLLDNQAGATLAGRLMDVQRQKLAEVQMLDRSARRVLHDDILPQLHACLLLLARSDAPPEAMEALTAAHSGISHLLREMPLAVNSPVRLGFVAALEQEIASELQGAFDAVEWHIDPEAARALAGLPSMLAETLFFAAREAVRNSARYGRGANRERPLALQIRARCREDLLLEIEDDGAGLAAAREGVNGVPGEAAPEATQSGSVGAGQGLVLHGTLLAVAGGQLVLGSGSEGGVRVSLRLPREAYSSGS